MVVDFAKTKLKMCFMGKLFSEHEREHRLKKKKSLYSLLQSEGCGKVKVSGLFLLLTSEFIKYYLVKQASI